MTNHLIFPTPVMEDRIESDLEQYVTELSKVDKGVTHSNRGGYQSKHFTKPEKEFQDLISDNKFYEYAKIYNHYYGTSKDSVENLIKKNDIILKFLDRVCCFKM